MTTLDSIDDYTRIPSLETSESIALATDLLGRVPKQASKELVRDAKKLRSALAALKADFSNVLNERANDDSKQKTAARLDADNNLDRAWSALEARLSAWAKLSDDFADEKARAASLHTALFASGLDFLNFSFRAEWAESDARLRFIEEKHLTPSLLELAGKSFVTNLQNAHSTYGKALGIGTSETTASPTTVGESLNALRSALRKYARQVVAQSDEADEESIKALQHMLEPIALVRSRAAAAKNEKPTDAAQAPKSEA